MENIDLKDGIALEKLREVLSSFFKWYYICIHEWNSSFAV